MNTIKLLEILRTKSVFSTSDIERIASANRRYAGLILSRLLKRNIIKKVASNRYTLLNNPFVVASNIIYPCYISFWSASYYYKFTEQIPKTIQLATTIRKKSIQFEGYTIEFMLLKQFFGYRKESTSQGDVFIAEQEKLLIDAFLCWKKMGNFDEIKKLFTNADISKEKLVSYLKKINNQTLTKRVGYLLFKIKNIDISNSFKFDRNYMLLNPFSKKWKSIDNKWRIKYD